VALASRQWIVVSCGVGVVGVLVLAIMIARDDFAAALLAPVLLALGYFEWRRVSGFIEVHITPSHLALRYLVGERRIALDDVVSVKLRVDMAGLSDELLNAIGQQAGFTEKQLEWQMHAGTKYRAWVTTSDAEEYRSVRFDDVQRFHALQQALQFAF